MGRLRDKRRGGGAARTITGLTRTGTANKLVGSRGGIQNPIVNDVGQGTLVEVEHTSGQVITTTNLRTRATAALLCGADFENGGPYPTGSADIGEIAFVVKDDNLLTWTNGGDCTFTFWVF